MNLNEIFKAQIDKGATEMFFYGLESQRPHEGVEEGTAITISIMRHKGSLDSLPTNLEFIRMMGGATSTPLFKEVAQ